LYRQRFPFVKATARVAGGCKRRAGDYVFVFGKGGVFMAIKLVDCFDWEAENRPGKLLEVNEQLAKQGVNLDALWAYTDHEKKNKIAAIGKKSEKLSAALGKLGVRANKSQCFYATGADKAGALVKTLRALADAGINIICLDGMATGGRYAVTFWVGDADLPRAKQVLKVR
jgi:hypothetical protein